MEQIWNNDIVRTTMLTSYVGQCLVQAEMICGGSAAFQQKYLTKADDVVIEELKREIAGAGPGSRKY